MKEVRHSPGKLKVDHTENVLLDIRQALLTCEQMRAKIIKYADDKFQEIVGVIKERRANIKEEINQYFNSQKDSIITNEERWKEKQLMSQELLKLSSSESTDAELIQSSKIVMNGINSINEPLKFQELKLVASMNDAMKIGETEFLTNEQMMKGLKDYMQISEYKNIQYKA